MFKGKRNIFMDAHSQHYIFFFLFRKTLHLGVKMKARYARKIFLRHFWKLKFCRPTLSTWPRCVCLAATPISRFLSVTHARLPRPPPSYFTSFVSPPEYPPLTFLFRLPCTRARVWAGRINIFVSVNRIRVVSVPRNLGEFRSHFGNRANIDNKAQDSPPMYMYSIAHNAD